MKCKAVKVHKCDFVLIGELECPKLWVKHRLKMMRMVWPKWQEMCVAENLKIVDPILLGYEAASHPRNMESSARLM